MNPKHLSSTERQHTYTLQNASPNNNNSTSLTEKQFVIMHRKTCLNLMYYRTKKSASLHYFDTCFMHNIGGVSMIPYICSA